MTEGNGFIIIFTSQWSRKNLNQLFYTITSCFYSDVTGTSSTISIYLVQQINEIKEMF